MHQLSIFYFNTCYIHSVCKYAANTGFTAFTLLVYLSIWFVTLYIVANVQFELNAYFEQNIVLHFSTSRRVEKCGRFYPFPHVERSFFEFHTSTPKLNSLLHRLGTLEFDRHRYGTPLNSTILHLRLNRSLCHTSYT